MKRVLAVFGLGALVAAFGVFVVVALAGDKVVGPNGEHQVVVCKYVGTPGVDERLQTGQNPIVVDSNALEEGFTGTFPWQFVDAQGRSIAIRWAADSHDGAISECPAPQGLIEVTASAPAFHDPTCPLEAKVDLPTVTGVTYTVVGTVAPGQTVTVRATAQEGYVLVGTHEWMHTFGNVPENCEAPIEVTATAPTFQEPTCELGAKVDLPTVTGVTYAVVGTVAPGQAVEVEATADEGYVLVGTHAWTHTFGNVPENCGAPPPEAIEVTPGVTFQDPNCEVGPAVVPTAATGLTYTIEGTVAPGEHVKVTASADDGYTIQGNNTWEHTFGLVPSNCVAPPAPTDICPNVEGIQEAVPDGYVLDAQGNCVVEETTTTTTPTAPLTPPTTARKPAKKAPAKAKPAPLTPPKKAVAGVQKQAAAQAKAPPELAHTP